MKEAHPDFTSWFKQIKLQFPDVHVSWAYRGEADQNHAFKSGKSKLEFPDSPHNKVPALAIDLFEMSKAHPGGKWDRATYTKIDQWNTSNGYKMRWGGNFKGLGDYDHFEVIP